MPEEAARRRGGERAPRRRLGSRAEKAPLRRVAPFVFLDCSAPWMRRLTRLGEWIAIPSISADAAHAADVRLAGEWLCAQIRAAGGDAELADWEGHRSRSGSCGLLPAPILRRPCSATGTSTCSRPIRSSSGRRLPSRPPSGTAKSSAGGGGRQGPALPAAGGGCSSLAGPRATVNVRFRVRQRGDRRPLDRRLPRGGRARRGRLRDLRQRDGRPGRAGVQHRDSRPLLPASHVAGRARPALGRLRRCRAQRGQHARAGAAGRPAGRRRAPSRAASRGSCRRARRSGRPGPPCRRAPTSSRVKARGRWTRRRPSSSTRGRGPSRRSM